VRQRHTKPAQRCTKLLWIDPPGVLGDMLIGMLASAVKSLPRRAMWTTTVNAGQNSSLGRAAAANRVLSAQGAVTLSTRPPGSGTSVVGCP
jgi:hypothetical protein